MQLTSEQLEPARSWIPNLRFVSETLIRGGQPESQGLKALKELGVITVVNLCGVSGMSVMFRSSGAACPETREVAEERQVAAKLGLNFISIPLDVFGDPPLDAINQFISIVTDTAQQPVFVHCLYGRDRTGLMSAIYRVKVHGWNADQAYAEMVDCGFDCGRTNLSDVLFSFAKQQTGKV